MRSPLWCGVLRAKLANVDDYRLMCRCLLLFGVKVHVLRGHVGSYREEAGKAFEILFRTIQEPLLRGGGCIRGLNPRQVRC